ncbi:MAG TPA: 5-formyltetrahydrofolate cyclo-ligase [Alphaproteobacteria bacterium]|nr:5-formyltetrahydrofolate cyclo-ligase [Alphaproteobacteria bacterium]
MDNPAAKADLRRAARQARSAAAAGNPDAAAALAKVALGGLGAAPGDIVAGYVPIGDEIDPMPLIELLAGSHPCALPSVEEGRALTFRLWLPGAALLPGRYGIPSPSLDSPAILPDILLVPMLAFDRRGHRLGYGGGHYDATLAALRGRKPVQAIGLAYAAQEIERVPDEGWDQALDAVATEKGFMRFGSERRR